jgi:CubicO group peptidase (beta-lactamase class C family)
MTRLIILLSFARALVGADAADVEARIRRVEDGLMQPVSIAGRPLEKFKLADRMQHHHVPGVSIAVIEDGAIAWTRGYGVAEAGAVRAITPETLFQAASISKPVAATAALRLVQDGRLSLDENVNRYLKSWHLPDNEFTKQEKVTLRRLLSHSAGLTVHGFPGYETGAPLPSIPQILDGEKPANTAAVRVETVPGTRFNYSGGGITIMQLVLMDVTGKSFQQLMQESVLEKIGMTHSTYEQPLPARRAGAAATAHDRLGAPVNGKWHVYPEMAAAGLWTTPSDLARFAIELQRSRRGESNRVLSKETTNQMLTRQIANWGLGIELQETGAAARFQHGGDNDGFHSIMMASMDNGYGAVVMTNSDGGPALWGEILMSIAAEYGWPGYKPRERKLAAFSDEQLEKYAGSYQSPTAPVKIRRTGDHLELSMGDFFVVEIYPESETRFFPVNGELPDLVFTKGATGAVESVTAGGITAKKTN